MRGFRFVPLLVVTVAMAVAVGAALVGKGLRVALAGSPDRTTTLWGGPGGIILIAAVATLPLVMLLVYLRRRSLPAFRFIFCRNRRHLALGLSALLIAFPAGPFVFSRLHVRGPLRTATVVILLGFMAYAVGVRYLIRWLDAHLPGPAQ
jgi:hypothetical protein